MPADACGCLQMPADACRYLQMPAVSCRCLQVLLLADARRCLRMPADACKCLQTPADACRCLQMPADVVPNAPYLALHIAPTAPHSPKTNTCIEKQVFENFERVQNTPSSKMHSMSEETIFFASFSQSRYGYFGKAQ